jgi:hypothetical protein
MEQAFLGRRAFLIALGALAAAAPAQAFAPAAAPIPTPTPEYAVATPQDIADAPAEKAYWVWRRPHRRHYYWRRGYRRCRYFVWRGRWWRRCW